MSRNDEENPNEYINPSHGPQGRLHSGVIPEEMFHVTETVIGNMNIVLEKIVPGLIIAVKALGSQLMPNGSAGKRIELVSSLDSIKTCNKQGICLSPGKPGESPGFTV